MLPSLGFQEILVVAVLALLVVGPKDLPLLLRRIGQFSAKMRAMAAEFRAGFDELARQAELDALKKEVQALKEAQPLREFGQAVTDFANGRDFALEPEFPAPASSAASSPQPGPEDPAPAPDAALPPPPLSPERPSPASSAAAAPAQAPFAGPPPQPVMQELPHAIGSA